MKPVWKKSSRSASGAGQCVEVTALDGQIAVRDSKNPEGPTLTLPRGNWSGFVAGLRR